MPHPDLNMLVTLDVLLNEGSVARAAKKLQLSPSAMSRALARLRAAMGDPLLVRSGRGLVPTPRALALRAEVGPVVEAAETILRPAAALDLVTLTRSFTLRTGDGFVENFGPALIARIGREAPGVRLRFLPKTEADNTPLREGMVDLETGVVAGTASPDFRTQALFTDRFVGVMRANHPLRGGRLTLARYAAARHVEVTRHVAPDGPVEAALATAGLRRDIAVIVGGFASALALTRASDLIATVPERHSGHLRSGLHSFPLPVAIPKFTVAMIWHPRVDADPAHRWLRACLREACAK